MPKKPSDFQPYVGRLRHSTLFPLCIVAAPTFEGAYVVYERPAMPEIGNLGLGVNALVWHKDRLAGGKAEGISRDGNITLQAAISGIKRSMLKHGAVAEAVQLIGDLSPFKAEELKIMAEKLKAKGGAKATATATKAPKKGDAEALKAAAAEAPVGGKKKAAAAAPEPAKRKGNIAALEKAREGGAAAREAKRKLKLTLVEKKNPKRPDSNAFHNYEKYKTAKTVGDFIDAGGTMADVNYDSKKGFIKLG